MMIESKKVFSFVLLFPSFNMILLEFLAMDLVAFMFLFILATTRSRTSQATLPGFQATNISPLCTERESYSSTVWLKILSLEWPQMHTLLETLFPSWYSCDSAFTNSQMGYWRNSFNSPLVELRLRHHFSIPKERFSVEEAFRRSGLLHLLLALRGLIPFALRSNQVLMNVDIEIRDVIA